MADEESASSFGLIVTRQVVSAELVEGCFVVNQVRADHQYRVSDSDQGSLLATPFRYPPATDTEVTAFRSRR